MIFERDWRKNMDIILYNIIIGLSTFLLGYFFGSIPTGVVLCKLIYHKDPRLEGSKNSGGTNVGRLFGKKMGILVIALDMIKTVIPLITVWLIFRFSALQATFEANLGVKMFDNGVLYIYLAPLGASIGHCYPVFARFKGGKAVATFGGFGLATSWFCSLIGFGTFFITLKAKKYVSLASIMAGVLTIISSWSLFVIQFFIPESFWHFFMWGWGSYLLAGWEYATVATLISILLIVRHAPNIKRLIHHEERKIIWMD